MTTSYPPLGSVSTDPDAWRAHYVYGAPKPNQAKRTDTNRARDAAATIAAAPAKTGEIVRAYINATNEAKTANYNADGLLSAAGVADARNKALETIKAAHSKALAEHRETVETAAKHLEDYAASEPLPDGDSMARRSAHWRRAEALLDAGRLPAQVIKDVTDPEALLALRDELPNRLNVEAVRRNRGINGLLAGPADASDHLAQIDRALSQSDHPAASYAAARAGIASLADVHEHFDSAAGVVERDNSYLQYAVLARANQAAQ